MRSSATSQRILDSEPISAVLSLKLRRAFRRRADGKTIQRAPRCSAPVSRMRRVAEGREHRTPMRMQVGLLTLVAAASLSLSPRGDPVDGDPQHGPGLGLSQHARRGQRQQRQERKNQQPLQGHGLQCSAKLSEFRLFRRVFQERALRHSPGRDASALAFSETQYRDVVGSLS